MVQDQFSGRLPPIPCDAILISGCQDWQKTADLKDVGQAFVDADSGAARRGGGGLLTTALVVVLEQHLRPSLAGLLRDLTGNIAHLGFDQVPQMSGSRPYDMRAGFDT